MKRVLLIIVAFFNLAFFINSPVYAQENKEETLGNFTIEGIPNPHQIDQNVGYFELHEEPGEEDQLKIKLINYSNQDKTLSISVVNGNTNSNGLVDYTGDIEDHISLKTPLKAILKPTQSKFDVPKKSEKEVTLNLKMPKDKFSGIILGGIQVSDSTKSSSTSEKNAINNKYVYTLGVVLKNNPQEETFKSVSVNLENVQSKLVYGKKIVQADFLNNNPYIFGKAKVKGTITDTKNNKVIIKEEFDNVSIAPNSVYPFQFDWKKEEIKPGNYVFKGIVKTKDKDWDFSKKFTITENQAKEMNENTVFKIFIPSWLKLSSMIFLILMFITSLVVHYINSRKEVS